MPWWRQQPELWMEALFGVVMVFIGLYVEDRIDQWRQRKHDATHSDQRDVF